MDPVNPEEIEVGVKNSGQGNNIPSGTLEMEEYRVQGRAKFHRFNTSDRVSYRTQGTETVTVGKGPRSQTAWRKKIECLLCCFNPRKLDNTSTEFSGEVGGDVGEQKSVEVQLEEYLIGPMEEVDKKKKTLVLDLDETLVHSSFKPVTNPDYVIPVEVEGTLTDVYVLRRPHLEQFLKQVCAKFEVVVFTASLSKYADPLLDLLDEHKMVRWRLFREACVHYQGAYVKDLAKLGRQLNNILIVDNSPNSYIFQPENAIPILAFIDDMEDRALLELLPILQDLATHIDVREGLKLWQNQIENMNKPELTTT